MSQIPVLFISHGAPDLPLRPSATRDLLIQLGQQLEKPTAILVISAHWNTTDPIVSAAAQPETIHDFSGFPAALYRLNYPAPGAPLLAQQIDRLSIESGFTSEVVTNRGLDPRCVGTTDANLSRRRYSSYPVIDSAAPRPSLSSAPGTSDRTFTLA